MAVKQGGQTAADRQPQPGAAVHARRVGAGLAVALEQFLLNLRSHADTAVLDQKAQLFGVALALQQLGAELDAPAGAELDGVADKVVEHLRQAKRVHQQRRAQARIGLRGQRHQVGAGDMRIGVGHLGHQRGDRDRTRAEFKLALLDLGPVQDVVEDAQQAAPGVTRGLQCVKLLCIEL